MRIAIFSTSLDIRGGYGNITYELCQRLKNRVDFTLYLPKSEDRNIYIDYPVKYILPEFVFSFKTRKFLNYLFEPNIEQIQDFDIIHSLFSFPYCILAAKIAKKYKKPLIIGAQGTYGVAPLIHWPEKYFLVKAYNQADLIFTPSQFTKEKIQEFSGTKTKIIVIHNGVDFDRFQKKQDIKELKRRFGGKKILLTVGGLKSRKGQDIVIQALAKIKPDYKNFHYFIIGEGSWMDYLRKLSQDLKLTENISFLGNLTGDELVKYFQFCDIYIHTPRNINWHFEGFGIVYLEASACSKPIIAADSGGIRDAVLENKTGLIVPEENIDKTARAILRLFQDSQLAKVLGKNGLKYAKEHNWSLIAQRFLDEYNNLIKR
jgi:phosphatidylinositol alpha-1,6-mannosyltransferase